MVSTVVVEVVRGTDGRYKRRGKGELVEVEVEYEATDFGLRVLTVRDMDTGDSIPEEDMKRLYGFFFEAANAAEEDAFDYEKPLRVVTAAELASLY